MMQLQFSRYLGLIYTLAFAIVGTYPTIVKPVQAQIIPDSTLGVENSVVTPTGDIDTITGGATRGKNLSHSFEAFSVLTDTTTFFDHALSIDNIFSRVTGDSVFYGLVDVKHNCDDRYQVYHASPAKRQSEIKKSHLSQQKLVDSKIKIW